MPAGRTSQGAVSPVEWPEEGLTDAWVHELASRMEANTRSGQPARALSKVLPKSVKERLFVACRGLLDREPTLVRVNPGPEVKVNVVGDTHGQYHDVLKLIQLAGDPSPTNWYVFNGDFVDRGAWGVETLTVLMAWKVAHPKHVFLLRGNHECEFCTEVYGYKRELLVKYGVQPGKALYKRFMELGAALPLAATVGSKTLVLHGGLFRGKAPRAKGGRKRAASHALRVGTLKELAAASKGGADPDGEGSTQIAGDVLWSDPAPDVKGLIANDNRGIGTMFGPDATKEFMETNGIALVLRSHEGPDAREDRPEMPSVQEGFCVDHDVEGVGKLCTVFSAPDYPQFVEEGEHRHHNKAAYVVLTGGASGEEWCVPRPVSFTAVKPRPKCEPYYDITVGGSDEEGPDGDLRVEKSEESDDEDDDMDVSGPGVGGDVWEVGAGQTEMDPWEEAEARMMMGSKTRSQTKGKAGAGR